MNFWQMVKHWSDKLLKPKTTGLAEHTSADLVTYYALSCEEEKRLFAAIERAITDGVYLQSMDDEQVVKQIQQDTWARNGDNLTRTAAYLVFYRRHPEIEWALLAHLVSRNGGWAMTDLEGEPVGRLIRTGIKEELFQFLERSNYLIFGDAYPQLLIWEQSMLHRRPLFHLLPRFGVSRAMIAIWEYVWEKEAETALKHTVSHRRLLTHALITNEQNFIEHRVVQNQKYQQSVIHSIEFQAQKWLDVNLVLFPYQVKPAGNFKGAGVAVHNFNQLESRIITGKQLYEILFGVPSVYQGCLDWACRIPHTGSRCDYDPGLYRPNAISETLGNLERSPISDPCNSILNEQDRLASPKLHQAWPMVRHAPVEQGDWCKQAELMMKEIDCQTSTLTKIMEAKQCYNITSTYCTRLKTMLAAASIESALTK